MRSMTLLLKGFIFSLLFAISLNVNAQRIGFLTHSVGSGLYQEGKVAEWFTNYNSANGTDFTIQRRSYPAEPYPWDNNPYDYWNVWVNGNCSEECFPSLLERFDIVIMKHCYTAAKIEADINAPDIASDRKSIENYKLQYRAIRDLLDSHPDTKFIVFTLTPRHRLRTYAAEAARAKSFAEWVKNEWLQEDGKEHRNIFIFDWWGYVAEDNATPEHGAVNCLRYEYEKDHSTDNSHPNLTANETMAPIFARFIVDVADGNLLPTGNKDILDGNDMLVSYMPGKIEVSLKSREILNGSFQLMDLGGRVVLEKNTHPDESRIYITPGEFARGVYIAKLTLSTGKSFVQKVVIH